MKKFVLRLPSGGEVVTDTQQLLEILKATGMGEEQAEKVAITITGWLEASNAEPLDGNVFMQKVISELSKVDKYAADFFVWYISQKEQEFSQPTKK